MATHKSGKWILLIVFFLCLFFVKSQSKLTENLYIRAEYHHGYFLAEYQFFNYLIDDNLQSVELNIFKKTKGNDFWQQIYHYPTFGISIRHSSLGNDEVFGKEYAIFPFFGINLVDKEKYCIQYKVGLGFNYVTKKFDFETNYKNIAIGSNINVYFDIELDLQWKIFEKMSLSTALSFHHFSNGNLQEPNYGLNYVTILGGINYLLGDETAKKEVEIPNYSRKFDYFLIYSAGLKHTRSFQSKKYFTSSISFDIKKRMSHKFHLGVGLDFFYDSSTKVEMRGKGLDIYENIYDYRTGFHLSQEFVYKKFSVVLQEGVYIFLTDKVNNSFIYNRGCVRYKISNHLFLNVSMKSHLHILDYPELGIGFYW